MLTAVFALAGSVLWGVGDFFGGLGARKISVLTVLVGSQAVGLTGAAVWVLAAGDPWPGWDDALPAAGAGLAGVLGLGALYRGMALGAMGIVAPISAVSPAVPLLVDIASGDVPSALQWLGIVVAVAGIVVLSREPGAEAGSRLAAGVLLALLAALAFGLFIVGLDAAAEASVGWTVMLARAASSSAVLAVALTARRSVVPPLRVLPLVVGAGLFDTLANAAVAAATTHGSAGIVAVLASVYPVVTIALAALVLGERLDPVRRAAGLVALAGAALVAAG